MRLIQATPCLDQGGEPPRHRLMTTRVREHNETESFEGMICTGPDVHDGERHVDGFAAVASHEQTPSASARAFAELA